MKDIQFEEVIITDQKTQKKSDAVAVIRDGKQVALLPEADRLRRALNLPIEKIQEILSSFSDIMGRNPTPDESEFWKAVLEYKRIHNRES